MTCTIVRGEDLLGRVLATFPSGGYCLPALFHILPRREPRGRLELTLQMERTHPGHPAQFGQRKRLVAAGFDAPAQPGKPVRFPRRLLFRPAAQTLPQSIRRCRLPGVVKPHILPPGLARRARRPAIDACGHDPIQKPPILRPVPLAQGFPADFLVQQHMGLRHSLMTT